MNCKACRDHRCHTKVEWRNHPLAGHGFTPETGWTHPDAKRLSIEEHRTANVLEVQHYTDAQITQMRAPEVTHGA